MKSLQLPPGIEPSLTVMDQTDGHFLPKIFKTKKRLTILLKKALIYFSLTRQRPGAWMYFINMFEFKLTLFALLNTKKQVLIEKHCSLIDILK